MSKGSKRPSWKAQRNTYNDITRQIAADAKAHAVPPAPVSPERIAYLESLRLPPNNHEKARIRRDAEKERLRDLVRAALAEETTP